jgi:hypothetical protein
MPTATTTTQKTPEQIAAEAAQATGQAATGQTQGAGTTTAIGTGTTPAPKPATTTTAPATSASGTTQTQTTQAGNSTQGTTPPASTVGSGVPPYAANYNAYAWMNSPIQSPMPWSNTQVATPGGTGVNWGAIPQYDANGTVMPGWTPPQGDSTAAKNALNQVLTGDASGMDVSAIKNRLKEQALQMEKDQMSTSRQAAAGRGMLDSGYQAGQERRIAGATQKDILGNFRSTDEKAAEQGTKNRIDASNVLNQVLTGDTSRADVGFDNLMDVATQQDQQNQFAATNAINQGNAQVADYTATNTAQQNAAATNLASYQSGMDVQNANRAQDLQVAQARTTELIARLGLAVNLEEVKRGTSQDKMRFLTEIFNTLVQNEQANGQLGLGYAQLGMSMTQVLSNAAQSIGL